jgi:hypothetical protein
LCRSRGLLHQGGILLSHCVNSGYRFA